MKLTFSGFEHSLDIQPGYISVLQVESVTLFTRVCQSLLGKEPSQLGEPFTVWNDEGKEVSARNAFLPIANLFNLPWQDRGLVSALYAQIDKHMKEDEEIRQKIEVTHQELESLIVNLGLRMNGNYSFGLEWEISQSLKAYSFGIDSSDAVTLFDNLIRFIEYIHDICYKKVLIFVNIEKFLIKNELLELEKHLFFHSLSALILMQGNEKIVFQNARYLCIDQEFLELFG